MTKLHTPWILVFALVAAPASASAQGESDGPISRLVGRFRQSSHQHQHVHAQPASPAYGYTYAQAEPAAVQEVQVVAPEAAPVAEPVAQEASPAQQEAPSYSHAGGCDPYGFMYVLNRIRASAGLHPLAYDVDLSSWAQQNNAEQCRRGLGHHVNPAGIQNCAYNYSDADSTAAGWMNSPGHRDNMLSPAATRFGIAFGPGPYWTLNAR